MSSEDQLLRTNLIELIRGGSAHADPTTILDGFPYALTGEKPEGAPYNAWELVWHLRFTLNDLLVFCTDPEYITPAWPDDYWPSKSTPDNEEQWKQCVAAFHADLDSLIKLAASPKTNLYAKIPWGDGQIILRELLLAGDHNSYHLGQLVLLRRLLGVWEVK